MINEGAEPIWFDSNGKIALHTIAAAGWIENLPEEKIDSWRELFNWPDTCCITPIGYTLLKNNIKDGMRFWIAADYSNLLVQFILCGNNGKTSKFEVLKEILKYKNDRLKSIHMDKAVRTVDIIRTRKSETFKSALKMNETFDSLEENLKVIKQFYKDKKMSTSDLLRDNVLKNEALGRYDMSGPKYLLVINVHEYSYPYGNRIGSTADEQLLRKKFNSIGFKSQIDGIEVNRLELTG